MESKRGREEAGKKLKLTQEQKEGGRREERNGSWWINMAMKERSTRRTRRRTRRMRKSEKEREWDWEFVQCQENNKEEPRPFTVVKALTNSHVIQKVQHRQKHREVVVQLEIDLHTCWSWRDSLLRHMADQRSS